MRPRRNRLEKRALPSPEFALPPCDGAVPRVPRRMPTRPTSTPGADSRAPAAGSGRAPRDAGAGTMEELQTLAEIVHQADDAIITKTLEGIVTTWNYGAEKLFGYTAAEMIGQS